MKYRLMLNSRVLISMSRKRLVERGLKRSTVEKPKKPYSVLITDAISSSGRERMFLSEIYDHIMDNHEYYRNADPGWKVILCIFTRINKLLEFSPTCAFSCSVL